MEIGVRQAKAELSRLIEAALNGESVIITNHGKPLVRLVREAPRAADDLGFGFLKGEIELPPGWDSPMASEEIADMFDHVKELKRTGQYKIGIQKK